MSKVYLRALEPEDFVLINIWRNSRELQALTCGHFRYVSKLIEKKWVESKAASNEKDVYLAICSTEAPHHMIGYASLNDVNHLDRKAHWGGIVIDPDYHHDFDYLLDSVLLILQHAFDDLNLNRLTGSCLSEHKASRRMMEMACFICEGEERQSIYKNATYHNVLKYSILASEYYENLSCGAYEKAEMLKRLVNIKKNKIGKQ